MQIWRIKALVQRVIAQLPYPLFWYGIVQSFLTRSLDVTRQGVERRLRACQTHWEHATNDTVNCTPRVALEVGTGWLPVIPIGLYLCGCERIHTFDIDKLVSRKRLREILQHLAALEAVGRLAEILPARRIDRSAKLAEIADIAAFSDPYQLLSEMGIECRVGMESLDRIESESVDMIVSHEVLEYVPTNDLQRLFSRCHEWLRVGGIMSHYIDLRDEYSYFDSSISPLNLLRYSDVEWTRKQNPIFPVNRLRLPDYVRLLRTAGFLPEIMTVERADASALDRIAVDSRFQHIPAIDLLVLNAWICAKQDLALPNQIHELAEKSN